MPPQGCPSIYPPKPPKPPVPEHEKCLTTDEICGNFSLPCGFSNFTVWNTTEVVPSGTVSIFYSDGCSENLTVSVTNSFGFTDIFLVPPHNTVSRTYSDLIMIRLTCPTEIGNNRCTGRYCLSIHYPVQLK
jgi:hypothetical protein